MNEAVIMAGRDYTARQPIHPETFQRFIEWNGEKRCFVRHRLCGFKPGEVAHTDEYGHHKAPRIQIAGKRYSVAYLAWIYHHGTYPPREVSITTIDDPLDFSAENLQIEAPKRHHGEVNTDDDGERKKPEESGFWDCWQPDRIEKWRHTKGAARDALGEEADDGHFLTDGKLAALERAADAFLTQHTSNAELTALGILPMFQRSPAYRAKHGKRRKLGSQNARK